MLSSAPVHRNAKDENRGNGFSEQQTKYQFGEFVDMSHWDSRSVNFPASQSTSACSLCENEPSILGDCESASGRTKGSPPPVCVDPNCLWNVCEDCSQSVCDECSDHEESCLDCVDQCGIGCKISSSCDELDGGLYDNCSFHGSCSELFGDQAAQIFDSSGRLPQLSSDIVPLDCGHSDLYPGDVENSGFAAGHGARRESSDSNKSEQPSRVPVQWPGLSQPLAVGLTHDHFTSSLSFAAIQNEQTPLFAADSSATAKTTRVSTFASSTPDSIEELEISSCRSSALPQLPRSLLGISEELSLSKIAVPASAANTTSLDPENFGKGTTSTESDQLIPCQWANESGQPCSMIFKLGSELHQHLKDAHSVKSENFCRWIGCRVGALGATPHRYASSVERHTWGHSGHRPYKCPTCSEGFAAANVRDEHYANFHLKKKLFSCDICTHQCTSARNLKRHKDEMHNTERFQCEFCNENGKVRLFPRASNLARHFRKCKYVLALFPNATGAVMGKIDDNWFPPGYRAGHQGMDKAKVLPPKYLPVPKGRRRGSVFAMSKHENKNLD